MTELCRCNLDIVFHSVSPVLISHSFVFVLLHYQLMTNDSNTGQKLYKTNLAKIMIEYNKSEKKPLTLFYVGAFIYTLILTYRRHQPGTRSPIPPRKCCFCFIFRTGNHRVSDGNIKESWVF